MVFDPKAAPTDRAAFLAWYKEQTEWAEDHTYDDPAVTTEALRAWFFDMLKQFPAMNGPHATRDDDDPSARVSNYCIGRSVIYVAFAWSQAGAAFEAVMEHARKHGVGFYDVSSSQGAVWLPRDGDLICAHANG